MSYSKIVCVFSHTCQVLFFSDKHFIVCIPLTVYCSSSCSNKSVYFTEISDLCLGQCLRAVPLRSYLGYSTHTSGNGLHINWCYSAFHIALIDLKWVPLQWGNIPWVTYPFIVIYISCGFTNCKLYFENKPIIQFKLHSVSSFSKSKLRKYVPFVKYVK